MLWIAHVAIWKLKTDSEVQTRTAEKSELLEVLVLADPSATATSA